jgi:2-oxoglutarate ferredoxin oxidoreductase subunit alpha
MSDQSLAQSDASIAAPATWPEPAERLVAAHSDTAYERYALTANGISPMAIPGDEDMMYTADGLEHDVQGTPSAAVESHQLQLDKRARKLAEFEFGEHWAEIDGEGDLAILCWGSVWAVANEAARQLRSQGKKVRVIALRLLAPLRVNALRTALEGVQKLLIVEQSHGAQFRAWIRSHLDIPCDHIGLALPGPLPIRPGQILAAFEQFESRKLEVEDVANC